MEPTPTFGANDEVVKQPQAPPPQFGQGDAAVSFGQGDEVVGAENQSSTSKPGFFSRVGEALGDPVSSAWRGLTDAETPWESQEPGSSFYPVQARRLARSLVQPAQEHLPKAAQALGKGQPGTALDEVLRSVPVYGSAAGGITDKMWADRDNPAAATGDLIGGALPFFAVDLRGPGPKAVEGTARGGTARIASQFRTDDPFAAAARVLKPPPNAEGLPVNLRSSIAATKKYTPGFEPAYDPATGTTNIADAFKTARMAHHEAMEPYLTRAEGFGAVPHQPIIDATQQAVARMPASEQAAAQALIAKAQQDWAGLGPRQMLDRIDLVNGRDASFYNKSTAGQSAGMAQLEQAVDKAQADAARNSLYQFLDPENAGAGPRAIRRSAGDLHELENEARRRAGAITAEQPMSPFGRAVEPFVAPVRAAWSAVRGNPNAGFSYAVGSEGRSIPLMKRAFGAVDEPYPDLPKPQQPFYPTTPPPPSRFDSLMRQEAHPPMASVSPRVNPVTAKTSPPSVYDHPVVQSNSFAQQQKSPASTFVKRLDVGSEVMHRGRAAKVKAVNPDGTAAIEYTDSGPDLASPGGR